MKREPTIWENIFANDNLDKSLISKIYNQDRRPNKEFPRQKKSKRIYLHQTSSVRDAKGAAVRKGRKREKEGRTQVQRIGNE